MNEGLSLYIAPPLVAAGAASVLLRILASRRRVPMDRPNERSLHSAPVPRVGGLAVVPAFLAAWILIPQAIHWTVWGPAIVLFAFSYLDDSRGLPVWIRFAAHLIAAGLVAAILVEPGFGALIALAAAFAIAWMTNLYNFMDGSDGLAGGMAIFGFGGYAIAAFIAGSPAFSSACLAIVFASLVFLHRNFHPAKVFLGDCGSIPLGFLSAALGVQGWVEGLWPAWFPLVVFSPFIVDASTTLLRRCLRGEPVWRAHREHYYQRLVRLGWGHRRTALAAYFLMLGCAAIALLALEQEPIGQGVMFASCAMLYLLLGMFIDRAWRRHLRENLSGQTT